MFQFQSLKLRRKRCWKESKYLLGARSFGTVGLKAKNVNIQKGQDTAGNLSKTRGVSLRLEGPLVRSLGEAHCAIGSGDPAEKRGHPKDGRMEEISSMGKATGYVFLGALCQGERGVKFSRISSIQGKRLDEKRGARCWAIVGKKGTPRVLVRKKGGAIMDAYFLEQKVVKNRKGA